MILVETSIWLDHLRQADPELEWIAEHESIASHPLIVGKVAVGSLRARDEVLAAFARLPTRVSARIAHDARVHGN